jgi:diacylglycerol kinase family enzyme
MKILFVVNPTSGKGNVESMVSAIETGAARFNADFRILYTTGQDDDGAIQNEVRAYGPQRVVACGGDGTIQLVARNLMNLQTPLGIIPKGSANGLAKALNIPADVDAALEIVLGSAHTKPLDFLKINDQFICIHLSDIGTNALLVKNYEEAGDKGLLGYAKHLISSILESDLMRFTIITPKETLHKEGYMLMLANADQYGTGVKISDGSVSDGRFEICNVQKIDLESAVKAGLTAFNVFIDKDMFSDVISCEEARIKIDRKAHLQIDGEYMGEFDEVSVKIIKSPLHVIVQ